jgi:Helix-turn-helix domain
MPPCPRTRHPIWLANRPNRTWEDAIETAPPTINQLASLPPTIDLMTAAKILGIGRTKAYELARHGEFPCLVIRVGDLYRVSTSGLLRLLGISTAEIDAPPAAAWGRG